MANPAALHQQAISGAAGMEPPPPGGLLGQPSARPNEPITAGMAMGAGPGPEAVPGLPPQVQRTATLLRQAAEITGNPRLAQMADRMEMRPKGY